MNLKGSGKSSIFFVFLVLLGALTGSLLGEMLGDITVLKFLKHVYTIGTSSPVTLNLRVVTFTIGLNLNMNIMSIIGVIVAIILYRKY
jgi:hypothetical protein